MDLRLRSNSENIREQGEARRPFPRKPSGRRVFCPWPALARSLQPAAGRCARPRPPWPQPKSLAAAPLVVCGVEEWRGGVKAGRNCVRPFRLPVSEYPAIRFVSTPRSSNRTCPFRASGFRSRDFMRSLTSGWRSLGPVVAIPSPGADTGARGASHSRPDSAVCHSTTVAADAVRGCPPPGKLG